MARGVQLLPVSDFSSGLRLDVDAFQLGNGESPDLLNVDVDPRGGIAQRRAVTPMNTSAAPFTSALHSLWAFSKTDGTEQVLVGSGKYTYYGTGTNFTSIGTTYTVSTRQRSTTFRDACYIQNGTDAPRKWTGSAVSNLTQTFVDNIEAPTDGNMPIAKCVTAWQKYVWVANTTESATAYGSRVRWSHPNRGEDWRADDYIDIDVGRDGDQITALVPMSDRLLVFKNRSMYAITGYDPDTFSVNFVAAVGTPTQESLCATEYGVYFFSWPEGVHLYTDRGVQWQFEALFPAIRDGDIPDAYHAEATMGWLGRRVWCSVPWGASTKNARTFVLTPGKQGGWTAYDLPLGAMTEWRRIASESQMLALTSGHASAWRVLNLDQDADTDAWYTNYLTHVSGGYASAPDTAATSITGDLDVRALLSCADWTPSSFEIIASKWTSTSNQRSWRFGPTSSGGLQLEWSANGTAVITKASTANMGLTDGALTWVRFTLDVDNGAAGNDVKFYTSPDGTTWTQLGATITTAGVTSIFDSTSPTYVGISQESDRSLGAASIYLVEMRNGIAGTVVANPDLTKQTATTTSFVDDFTNTWTLATDTFNAQSTNISSYYMTRWFDGGSPAVRKRWKRPELVVDSDYSATLRVGIYKDYEPTVEERWFNEIITAESSGSLWGSFNWGSGTWGATDTGAQEIDRGALLGRARAVALKFTGPSPSARWSVNSVQFKYVARPIR